MAVTDKTIDDYVVHTVFCLFDVDGDGQLSDREFLSVMKDRLHRGFQQPRVSIYEYKPRCIMKFT